MKDISLHILDIMENSVRGGASRIEVNIKVSDDNHLLIIQIIDNGRGMDQETVAHVNDPFFSTRSTRKIGMGLSLFQQQAEQTGGEFKIKSEQAKGTEVDASFVLNNIDRQPLGDVAGVIVNLSASYPDIDVVFDVSTSAGNYHFSSYEISKILGAVPLNNPDIMLSLKEIIETSLIDIKIIN